MLRSHKPWNNRLGTGQYWRLRWSKVRESLIIRRLPAWDFVGGNESYEANDPEYSARLESHFDSERRLAR